MSDRIPVFMLDPAGATDGQVPAYDAATGRVEWADGSATGGGSSTATGELLTVDGVTPPENVTTEAADDWLYQG